MMKTSWSARKTQILERALCSVTVTINFGTVLKLKLPELHGLMGPSQQDRAKAHTLNNKLRKQLAEFRAPQVMMYVKEKILNGDLEKIIKMWERKVEIAEVSLLSSGKTESLTWPWWQGIGKYLKPPPSSFRICLSGWGYRDVGRVVCMRNLCSCFNCSTKMNGAFLPQLSSHF